MEETGKLHGQEKIPYLSRITRRIITILCPSGTGILAMQQCCPEDFSKKYCKRLSTSPQVDVSSCKVASTH